MKYLACLFISFALFFSACAPVNQAEPLITPNPSESISLPSPTQSFIIKTPSPSSPQISVQATSVASAAYVYNNGTDNLLYGSIEYINSSSVPIVISNAVFSFNVSGAIHTYSFTPILADKSVLFPGETSFITVWLNDFPESFLNSADVSLSATLSAQKADDSSIHISVDNLFLADNYPNYSTLSGRLKSNSSNSCSMNIIHAGFYDENNIFLGAWYFTKSAVLEPNSNINFVTHLTQMPLNKLSDIASSIKAVGFGFNPI